MIYSSLKLIFFQLSYLTTHTLQSFYAFVTHARILFKRNNNKQTFEFTQKIEVEKLKPITNSTDPPTMPPTTTLPSVDPCQDPSVIDAYISQNSITPFGTEIAVLNGTCYMYV